MNEWIIPILTLVFGGGTVATVFTTLAGRKKQNADVSASTIKDALDIERVAQERYLDTLAKLDKLHEDFRVLTAYTIKVLAIIEAQYPDVTDKLPKPPKIIEEASCIEV